MLSTARLVPALRSLRLTPSAGAPRTVVASFDDVAGAEILPTDIRQVGPEQGPLQSVDAPNAFLAGVFSRVPEPRACRVAIVPQGRLLTRGGVVVTPADELVLETLWDEHHREQEFGKPHRYARPQRLEGRHASLMSLWCDNYYHWMIDALPRLAVLRAAGLGDLPLIVPDTLGQFHRDSLALAGVSTAQLVGHRGDHVVADELVWATPPAHIAFPSAFVVDWLRTTLGRASGEPGRRRLLVVRRGNRRIANEDEVVRALEPHGFEVVDPAELSLTQQIATFGDAAVVIGVHGAALTNSLFSRDAVLIELFQEGFLNPYYFTLACAAGNRYWHLAGDGDGTKSSDVHVPVDKLLATLAAAT